MALINGTALDDVLATTAGADTLTAMGGNDVVYITLDPDHAGLEKLDGGAGIDRLWFTGGTSLTLIPTKVVGFEVVQIADEAGNTNGTGAYSINAAGVAAIGTGFTLTGNAGANGLTGTAGKDLIIGGNGADTIVAGAGADRVVMSINAGHSDAINAGALTELNTLALVGTALAAVQVDLSAAGDQLGGFADTQSGFANLDASGVIGGFGVVVTGSTLKNVIVGSKQDDIFLFAAPTALGTDVVAGGGGTDTLRFTSATAGQILVLSAGVAVERAQVADAAGVTTGTTKLGINALAVKEKIELTGNDGINALTGGAFNDTLNGNGDADSLAGGAGNDVYVIDSASDWVLLDAIGDTKGTDDRIAFTAADTVGGATLVLNAKITGIEGLYMSGTDFGLDDTTALNVNGAGLLAGLAIYGNAGVNQLTGGKGNDTLISGGGDDTIIGGLGADRIVFDIATAAALDGGLAAQGNTLALVGTLTGLITVDLRFGVNDTMSADQYLVDGVVQTGFTHVDASELEGTTGGVSVTGSSLVNKITGSDLDDVFVYTAPTHLGTDIVNGGDGNDTLRFASLVAGQTLAIGAKVTNLEVAEIADAAGLTTGTTALNINAGLGAAALLLRGNDGKNTLTGTKEGDTLQGQLGADVLTGGLGDDTYLYEKQADFELGERITDSGGVDTVKFVSLVGGEILTMSAVTGIENYVFDAEGVTNLGYNLAAVTTAANVQGNDADNFITGTNVTASGDTLVGGLGADTLVGGAGNDRLEGGEGIDSILGGAGSDIIAMSTESGDADEINAGTSASEKNVLVLTGEGFDTVVDFRVAVGADQITSDPQVQTGFDRVDASSMTSEFASVTVWGRNGIDSISGSAGPDVFIPGLGNDTIEGGAGNDMWVVYSIAELGLDVYNDSGGSLADYLFVAITGGTVTIKDTNLNGVDVVALGDPLGLVPLANTANVNINASANLKPLSMAGNAGNNILTGTKNGETFFDWGGSDSVNGGEGSDEYVILDTWTAGDRINDTGLFGTDQFYLAFPQLVVVTAVNVKGVERFTVSGGGLNEGVGDYIRDITAHVDGGIDVSGLAFAVNLAGSYGDNSLRGTALADTIIGWNGQDTIFGGAGADTITMSVGVADDIESEGQADGSKDWDQIDAGLIGEGNLWVLVDAPTGVVTIDLMAVDQLVSIVDPSNAIDTMGPDALVQSGFLHVDASGMRRPGDALETENFGVVLAGTTGVNRLTGTGDADVFLGRGGADSIVGGGGNDIFVIASQTEYNTALTFDGGSGDDVLSFSSPDRLIIGDATNNSIAGGLGNDTLVGGDGNDTLTGGAGADLFRFDSGLDAATNVDSITDFVAGTDKISLDPAIFANLSIGPLNPQAFKLLGTAAVDGSDRILYDSSTGALFYDADGDGIGATAVQFATLVTTPEITAAVFVIGAIDPVKTLTLNGTKSVGIEKAVIADEAGLTTGTTPFNIVLGTGFTSGMELIGNDGDNSMVGTVHADTLNGNGGADTLAGGTGNDHYVAANGAHVVAGDRITDSGGTADRFVFISENTLGDSVVLTAQMTGLEYVEMHDGPDTLVGALDLDVDTSALPNGVVFTGNKFANDMTGTAFNDTIDGGAGVDSINAGAGADVITMRVEAADADNVNGGLSATEGNKLVLIGDPGMDLEFDLAAVGNQIVAGLAGLTITNITSIDLSGLEGDWAVTFTGTTAPAVAGPNVLIGTANDDVFVLARVLAPGEVIDGGLGDDVLRFTAAAPATLALTGLVAGIETVEFTPGAFDLNLTAGVVGNALTVIANDGNNAITGTAFADTIEGGAGADTITGLAGSDVITVDAAVADVVNGGLVSATEANKLVLVGTAGALVSFDLTITAGDQSASMAGEQRGFTHFDASGMTGDVAVIGSAAANQIGIGVGAASAAASGGAGVDTLILGGAAGATVMVDLSSLVDQVSTVGGAQIGFENVDASAVSGAGVNITGSAGADLITGSAQADTILGGLGADTVRVDVAGAADTINAGGLGEGNRLVLTGALAAVHDVDLRVLADQMLDMGGAQTGFQHVDASALTGNFGVNVIGNGLNNQLIGTLKGDTLVGGAGADTFILGGGVLGDGAQDRVTFETLGDGASAAGAAVSFDRMKEFISGQDKIAIAGDFNTAAGLYNLDDITDNNAFVWATDAKANFATEDEAMLITSAKSGLRTELALTASGFASVVSAINKTALGVIAGAGDDGLILVQMQGGTVAAPIQRTGVYYYQESDGIANKVSAGELTLLGIVETKISELDVAYI